MTQSFSKFTNKYSLSKTLRFELRPVGNTKKMLEENAIINNDKKKKEAYEKTKPFIDRLHRDFIKEALIGKSLSKLDGYFEVFGKFRKEKNNKELNKERDRRKGDLRKEILGMFNEIGRFWAKKYEHLGIKNKNFNILFEEGVFGILKEVYGDETESKIFNENGDQSSIFDGWKGFTGYFSKFFETRKNFYTGDGKSTALATRIVNQNLDRFLDNLITFNSIKDKIDIGEVEKIFDLKADDIFKSSFYNSCLLQEGIDKYNEFIGGINEVINKHRQDTNEKISFLKKLDKQILSEKEKFLIDEIESDEQLEEVLNSFLKSSENKVNIIRNLLNDFFISPKDYNLEGIFISKEAINTISHKWMANNDIFSTSLYETLKAEKLISKSGKKDDGTYSFPDFISLAKLRSSLINHDKNNFWKDRYYQEGVIANDDEQRIWDQFLSIFKYEFESLLIKDLLSTELGTTETIGFDIFKSDLEEILNDFKVNNNTKFVIKNFADNLLHIYQMAKYFALEKKREWNTEYDSELDQFYTAPDIGYLQFYENAYEEIVQVYNKIRNYLTKKPYSQEKWKLNFENPTLAKGWDKNKETDNSAVILRKDGNYYLAVMKKGNSSLFLDSNISNQEGIPSYEKFVYKLLPGANKMLPKVFFSAKNIEFYNPSEKILTIRNHSSHTKNGNPQTGYEKKDFDIDDCHEMIDFFKESLEKHPEWKEYDFKFKNTKDYQDISAFYREVENQGYKISVKNISENYIDEKNRNGELFLFQIYNKDFSDKSTGSKNLHTLYFQELFSSSNKKNNFPFKLNGEAELFFRPKSIEKEFQQRNFKREVINKNRYTENKMFFHIPITLNRVAENIYNFNNEMNDFLANNPDINIIGVDRGEKHLAYYSVIDQKGKLLKSDTLNIINTTDYHKLLEDKADQRKKAKQDWQEVEAIKDLKKGYISQVVHKLADLAIEHNAIIVMEDLNMRFKQIRGGIEKSVYQQLEKALIEKLNFLVNKNEIDPEKAGHLLKAYQLTAPFDTFQKMGKQTGIIFYTQASYTSKIDPLTGWRPNLYLKYSSAQKAKEDILKFKNIEFRHNRFEFTYDLKTFIPSQKEYPNTTEWTICSNVERFRYNKNLNNNKGDYEHYKDTTDNFIDLFNRFNISKDSDILEQIQRIDETRRENAKFFKDFIFYLNLVFQIRNTHKEKEGNENDFILSPVEPFFDSRKAEQFSKGLPKNGDENGAYNIARKGIIILNKISEFKNKYSSVEKFGWKDLNISHVEWDNFAQSNRNR